MFYHVNREYFETAEARYEINIGLLQIEITNKCNYNCKHCREGNNIPQNEINPEYIEKTIDFIQTFSPSFNEVTLSGGEPFISKDIFTILKILKSKGISKISITTNASLIDSEIIKKLEEFEFQKLNLSISMEYIDKKKFNEFRGNKNAYDNVCSALKLLKKYNNVTSSLRVSMTKDNIDISKMKRFVNFAIDNNCNMVKFMPILPIGKALKNNNFIEKKEDLNKIRKNFNLMYKKFSNLIRVETNDPLLAYRKSKKDDDEYIISGCGAGILTFNLMSNGDLTPCSLLPNTVICNVKNLNYKEIVEKYKKSKLIKDFIEKSFSGKCGKCNFKFQCGGCRARTLGINNNILGSDPLCLN